MVAGRLHSRSKASVASHYYIDREPTPYPWSSDRHRAFGRGQAEPRSAQRFPETSGRSGLVRLGARLGANSGAIKSSFAPNLNGVHAIFGGRRPTRERPDAF